MIMRLLFLFIGISVIVPPGWAQEWKDSLRHTDSGPEILDAPDGYRILDAPSATARVLETAPAPAEVEIV